MKHTERVRGPMENLVIAVMQKMLSDFADIEIEDMILKFRKKLKGEVGNLAKNLSSHFHFVENEDEITVTLSKKDLKSDK